MSYSPPPAPNLLYHYTNVAGLHGIVNSKSLWATQIQYMNDAKEYGHAVELAMQEADKLKPSYQGTDDEHFIAAILKAEKTLSGARTFIFSLTEEPDLLSQWRAYCPSGGFSVGFPFSELLSLATSQGFKLAPCVYDEVEQRRIISRVIDDALKVFQSRKGSIELELLAIDVFSKTFYGNFHHAAVALKHPSFFEEREWRLIGGPFPYNRNGSRWRPKESMLIPYLEFTLAQATNPVPISEVYVGPSPNQSLLYDSAQFFLLNQGLQAPINIKASAVPYRTRPL